MYTIWTNMGKVVFYTGIKPLLLLINWFSHYFTSFNLALASKFIANITNTTPAQVIGPGMLSIYNQTPIN